MWVLKCVQGDRKIYLLTGKNYTIGRKGTDIVILNDNSISRKHASIEIIPSAKNNCGFQVYLNDYSKFGLFFGKSNKNDTKEKVSFVKVVKQQEISTGDIIRVGLQNSLLRLENEPLHVVTSMLDSDEVEQLESVVGLMGGSVMTVWGPGITHLVTRKIILNLKVSQALACSCPIVTPQYFEELRKVFAKEGVALPQTDRFLPEISEPGINKNDCSFLPNPLRTNLFMGKTFVFLSKKQMKRFGTLCKLASANTILVNDKQFNAEIAKQKDTCVVFCANETELISSKKYENLQEQLITSNLRFIQEHEIGLSLLYVSTDIYCNPSYELNQTSHQQKPSVSQVIPEFNDKETETVGSNLGENKSDFSSAKRKRSEEDDATNTSQPKCLKASPVEENPEDFFSGLTSFRKPKRKPPPKAAPKKKVNPVIIIDDDNKNKAKKQNSIDCSQNQSLKINDKTEQEFKFQPIMESTEKIPDNEMSYEAFPDSCISDDSLWCSRDEIATKPPPKSNKRLIIATNDLPEKYLSPVKKIYETPEIFSNSVNVVQDSQIEDKPAYASTDVKIKQEQPEEVSSIGRWLNSVSSQIEPPTIKHEKNVENFKLVKVVQMDLVVKRNKNQFTNTISLHQGKNFKKFRKVLPTYMGGDSPQVRQEGSIQLPQIIGGSDLIRHDNRLEQGLNWDVSEEVGTNNDFEQDFSQDSNPFAKLKKRSTLKRRR